MRVELTLAGLLFATAAEAQWHYSGEQSAFGGGGTHIALTAKGSYAFGIRCSAGDMTAVLLTPERLDDEDAKALQNVDPTMLLRVDDLPPISLQAEIDANDGKLRASAEIEFLFAEQVLKAKRRVAVALGAGGDQYHENSFNVVGSTKAIGKLIKGCGVETPSG